jgi:hypothetical protein
MFDKETRQLINRARTLGSGSLSIYLEDHELLRLCAVVATDLNKQHLISSIAPSNELSKDYFGMSIAWFSQPIAQEISFIDIFLSLKQHIVDFATYFEKLCELHKRRLKFNLILKHQPFPHIEQIVPRCLLEFGLRPPEVLASWLVWRKWLYDVDNRAAQETGYLFEPILAAAIGGVPYAAKKSPIKRADDPLKGRQVDCLDGKLAYEFKMRVTDASSGQGRMREELDFAHDCSASGYVPVLLVLDATLSSKLTNLKAEYEKYGGYAYIGDDAWKHIEEKAGQVMGTFVEKYVKAPLQEVEEASKDLQPIHFTSTSTEISVQVGTQAFLISRSEANLDFMESSDSDLAEE